jgi:hypothetical protein
MTSLFLTLLILAQVNALDMVSVIRVGQPFAAVSLALQATIVCSHSRVPRTVATMASALKQEPAHVTTVGAALIVPLSSSAQEVLRNALAMVSASPVENVSALLAIQGTLAKRARQSVPRIAPVVAIAAKLRSASVTTALPV